MKQLIRTDKRFIFNVSALLGIGLTVVATINGTIKATKLVDENMSTKEIIQKTWKCYIPTSILMSSTMLCIIYSDHLAQKEKISLLAAMMSIQNNYIELKRNVDEICDNETKDKIRHSIVKNKIPKDVYLERTEDKLFYEEYSGKFFTASIDKVLKAEYAFNKQLSITGLASLNDLYNYIGIEETDEGKYLGWASEVDSGYFGSRTTAPWVDFIHDKMIDDDGIEYYFIGFANQPEVNYDIF